MCPEIENMKKEGKKKKKEGRVTSSRRKTAAAASLLFLLETLGESGENRLTHITSHRLFGAGQHRLS